MASTKRSVRHFVKSPRSQAAGVCASHIAPVELSQLPVSITMLKLSEAVTYCSCYHQYQLTGQECPGVTTSMEHELLPRKA